MKYNECFGLTLNVVLALVLACAPFDVRAQGQMQQRPNILWISAEDLSPRLGAYGDSIARTPNLGRLAQQGIRYARAFTTAGVCAPSRSAIITGMYQTSIGTHHMRTRIHDVRGLPESYQAVPPPYVKTFTEYLRDAGYYTTNNAKTDYQFGLPFTAWDESSTQAHWRNRPDEDQPFFSVFNIPLTHESRAWEDKDDPLETDPSKVKVPPYYPDTPAVRRHLARHYDNIAAMDRRVGELLRQLEEDGLADETIVFFWTDHGDGFPRAKRWLYDSGIHVPLIVRIPEAFREMAGAGAPGTVKDRLVSLVDLGPTVLSLAGVPIPVHMQGRAFLGPDASGKEPRTYVFAARDRFDESYDMVRAVRGKRFKYIRNYYPMKPYVVHVPYRNRSATMQALLRLRAEGELEGPEKLWMRESRPPEELYDVRADPYEIHNLANDPKYHDVLERMRTALDRWMGRTDDLGDVPEARMVWMRWMGGEQPTTATPIILPRRSTGTPVQGEFVLPGPTEVIIYCGTQGASIGYTTEEGEEAPWKLYTGPIRIEETTTLRARAIRYGYEASGVVEVTFIVP